MKSASKKRAPTIVNLTVKRRYLTEREVERLMDCARKHGRYGHRDATMILVAYRHGLRASEVCDLQWQQIELSEPPARSPGQERNPQCAPNPG
jgi:integrase